MKPERTISGIDLSKSVSSRTIVAFLPPSSKLSFLNIGAAVAATILPVVVPPVKDIRFTLEFSTIN